MHRQVTAAISELEPEGLAQKGTGLQSRKSIEMRETILDATVTCLATHGYTRTTNQLICEIAKVSRGAMLHHYPTRQDLIVAVIEYSFYKHMKGFSASIRALSERERVDQNSGIIVDWQSYLTPEYMAYVELHTAARTDEELKKLYVPRARHHDRVWRDELLEIYPEWRHDLRKLDLTRRLVRATLSGLAMNRDLWNDPNAEASLLGFLADAVRRVRIDELKFPSPDRFPALESLKSQGRRPGARAKRRA
ncbi:MAG TPA: TetR/AcrR family transcriptional regulator [Burkholderiales bacterium]|nr:TetR/AcrR family transcriptional regulator [Burkholderiales bacterium]